MQLSLDLSSVRKAERGQAAGSRKNASGARADMKVVVLGSGSGGNAVVVDSGGERLLVDAGFSCREIEQRLRSVGISPEGFTAVLVTHEHSDHIRGVARFAKRHGLPVYATGGTFANVDLGPVERRVISSGEPFEIGRFCAEAFSLPHDAREPVGFVIETAAGTRFGLAADLGARTQLAWGRLRDLDILLLETNHDLEMLRNGPYPWVLKQRVAGRHGHLSNEQAADGLPELLCDRLRYLVLYHLSRTNNLPALASEQIASRLDACGAKTEIVVSRQFQPTPWMEIPIRAEGNGGADEEGVEARNAREENRCERE